jgi:hypothetical protein
MKRLTGILLWALFVLAGCFNGGIGGTGSGTGDKGEAGGMPDAADNSGKSVDTVDHIYGRITSVSPLRVNGYDLSSLALTVIFDASTPALQPGMYVAVNARNHTLDARATARGLASQVQRDGARFVLVVKNKDDKPDTRINVETDAATVMADVTLDVLEGMQVAVYGYFVAPDALVATRIETTKLVTDQVYVPTWPDVPATDVGGEDAPMVAISLEGKIAKVDSSSQVLVVADWTLDYSMLVVAPNVGDHVMVNFYVTGPQTGALANLDAVTSP